VRVFRGLRLHPGVEALGYVNSTTPLLLSSTSFASVVLVPSCVSISPPKAVRSIVSPTLGGEDAPVGATAAVSPFALPLPVTASLTASTFSTTAAFAFSVAVLGAAFFLAGRTGAGGGVLRFLSSTMFEV
jgi:hypothetical protein